MELKKLIVRVFGSTVKAATSGSIPSRTMLPRVLDEKTLNQIGGGASASGGAFGPGKLPKKGW
jgi:hypothetical protein